MRSARKSKLTENWETSKLGRMKTTLDLPDALVLEIKRHALNKGLKLKDAMAVLLKLGLKAGRSQTKVPAHRVTLPLITCKQKAELTPEQVADALLTQEVAWHS
jgi:hypothetical protein